MSLKFRYCVISWVWGEAVPPLLGGGKQPVCSVYLGYEGGRCCSPDNTDIISVTIGAFREKRRRMQVFFPSMDTADRSSLSLIVEMVLDSSSVSAGISGLKECGIT